MELFVSSFVLSKRSFLFFYVFNQHEFLKMALLPCLGRSRAILAMLRPKCGRIRFNDGEAAYLRSCMRRFGWERRSDPEANCLWEETFSGVKLHDAVWWLIEEILQTRVSAEACIRHDPISISKARHSLAGISEATLALHAHEIEDVCRRK